MEPETDAQLLKRAKFEQLLVGSNFDLKRDEEGQYKNVDTNNCWFCFCRGWHFATEQLPQAKGF